MRDRVQAMLASTVALAVIACAHANTVNPKRVQTRDACVASLLTAELPEIRSKSPIAFGWSCSYEQTTGVWNCSARDCPDVVLHPDDQSLEFEVELLELPPAYNELADAVTDLRKTVSERVREALSVVASKPETDGSWHLFWEAFLRGETRRLDMELSRRTDDKHLGRLRVTLWRGNAVARCRL